MKQVEVTCILTRTVCFDDNVSEDNIKSSIILPTDALCRVHNILKNTNIRIPNLDLKDWDVKDVKYEISEGN